MKTLLFYLLSYGLFFHKVGFDSNKQFNKISNEDSSELERIYDSLCKIKADSILFVHVNFSEIESKGIFSWREKDRLFARIVRTKKGKIYSREKVDSISLLIEARNFYFSTEKSFPDTIHNAKWQASHEFWITYKSYDRKKEVIHFVNSTDVLFGPSNSITKATELFYTISAEK